jgi:hypothetical protein
MTALFDLDPQLVSNPPAVPQVTERDMLDALHRRYAFSSFGTRRYVVAEHVGNRPLGPSRIADFIAMDTWRSGRFRLHGHEVKTSRADWLRELKDPFKAAEFVPYMHMWWVVVPHASLVRPGELPDGWGLMALTQGSHPLLRAVHKPPERGAVALTPERWAALMRAVQRTAAERAHAEESGA